MNGEQPEEVPMAIVLADAPRRTAAAAPARALRIELEKTAYRPGETVRGSVLLGWPTSQVVRGVWWEAAGAESTHVTVTTGSGKHRHSTTYRETRTLVGCGSILFGARKSGFFSLTWEGLKAFAGFHTDNPVLPAGEYGYDFSFTLPPDLLPTYAGANVDVAYAVSARVDIPGGLDLTAAAPFVVSQEGNYWLGGFAKEQRPGSGLGRLFTADVEMELEAPDRRFRIGDEIDFAVRVKNLGGKHVRGLNVTLERQEWARARGHTASSSRAQSSLKVPADRLPLDGTRVPLAIRVPEGFLIHQTKISGVSWELRAELDIAWGIDASVSAPLDVREERG